MIGDQTIDVGGVCVDAELPRGLEIVDDAVTAEDNTCIILQSAECGFERP